MKLFLEILCATLGIYEEIKTSFENVYGLFARGKARKQRQRLYSLCTKNELVDTIQ